MKPIAIVTGASSGLGEAIAFAISHHYDVIDWSIENGIDVTDERCIENIAMYSLAEFNPGRTIDLLINCAGVNDIRYLATTTQRDFDRVMNTNARGIFTVTRALLPKLIGGTVLNIISTAARVPMTASLAYNASKAAAEMMTRQMARELIVTHGITVFGVSPNKLQGTAMSARTDEAVSRVRDWLPIEVQGRARAARLTDDETPPELVAEFIAFLVARKERHEYLAGSILEYGV
jgi:NAD(P)-dependent dehydrogenase (short-subunit alcohol dehydrogenase family)